MMVIISSMLRHVTLIIFCVVLAFDLASISWLLTNDGPAAFATTVASMAFSLGAIWFSEQKGFVRTRQMRRAFEPPRNFNGAQILTIMMVVMVQIGLASYFLIT